MDAVDARPATLPRRGCTGRACTLRRWGGVLSFLMGLFAPASAWTCAYIAEGATLSNPRTFC